MTKKHVVFMMMLFCISFFPNMRSAQFSPSQLTKLSFFLDFRMMEFIFPMSFDGVLLRYSAERSIQASIGTVYPEDEFLIFTTTEKKEPFFIVLLKFPASFPRTLPC